MSKAKLIKVSTIHGVDVAFMFITVLIVIGTILALFIKEERQRQSSNSDNQSENL